LALTQQDFVPFIQSQGASLGKPQGLAIEGAIAALCN
jgi:hypothetical protein